MEAMLILNPGSRSGRGRGLWRYWEERLKAAGASVRAEVTRHPEDATALARDPGSADTVVAVGGDGTISRALDGVLQGGRPGLRFGVLYSGTSPDFCAFHGIPIEPAAAVETLLGGHIRPVDVLRVRHRDASGQATTSHAGCGLNVGLGAAVARRANRLRPLLGDRFGTGLAALWAVATARPAAVGVQVDGAELPLPPLTHLALLKSPFIASGLRVARDLQPADGHLDLLAVPASGLWRRLRRLTGFYTGGVASDPGVILRRGTRVSLRSPAAQEIEFDGDPRGWLPAEVEVLPRALSLIVPEALP